MHMSHVYVRRRRFAPLDGLSPWRLMQKCEEQELLIQALNNEETTFEEASSAKKDEYKGLKKMTKNAEKVNFLRFASAQYQMIRGGGKEPGGQGAVRIIKDSNSGVKDIRHTSPAVFEIWPVSLSF